MAIAAMAGARKCPVGGCQCGVIVMAGVLELDGWDHADRAVGATVVGPFDVFGGRYLEVVDVLSGADLRIEFARRSSRNSFSSLTKRWDSLVMVPGRYPSSTSTCTTQLLKVSGLIPN